MRFAVIVIVIVASVYSYRGFGSVDAANLREMIGDSPFAGAGFVALHVIATLIFVPRVALVVAATLIFGPILGFAYATIGATCAAAACFFAMRVIKPDTAQIPTPPQLRPLLDRIEHGGWQIPTLALLVPGIPFTTKNYLLALLPVNFRNFSIATLVAHAPATFVFVYFTGTGKALAEGANIAIALVFVMVLLAGGLIYGVRRIR